MRHAVVLFTLFVVATFVWRAIPKETKEMSATAREARKMLLVFLFAAVILLAGIVLANMSHSLSIL